MKTKRCSTCKEIKPLSEFAKRASNSDGKQRVCKACSAIYQREYYKKHGDRRAASQALYYASNKDRIKAHRAIYRARPEIRKRLSAYEAEYCSRRGVKARRAAYTKAYFADSENIAKRAAHKAVEGQVRASKLPWIGSLTCKCGYPATSYHHYLGYAPEHWLDVEPLCGKCHYAAHKAMDVIAEQKEKV